MTNVILYLADDLGWADVGYHGGRAETPNIDRMAQSEHAVIMERFYSASPVCSPTRASFMTGRNPNRYCVWNANSKNGVQASDIDIPSDWPLPSTVPSVARLLRKNNVRAAVFGKWHLGDLKQLPGGSSQWPRVTPKMLGFREWNVTVRSAPTFNTNCGCFEPSLLEDCRRGIYPKRMECSNYYYEENGKLHEYKELIEDDNVLIADMAERFLRQRAADGELFFLYLPFHTVHKEYIGNEEWTDHYLNLGYDEEAAHYLATISGMDEQIGRVRAVVEELGLETMQWFTSDNGPSKMAPADFDQLRGAKGTLYEGGIRVPTIVEWSSVLGNRRELRVASSVDFAPTLAELWGMNFPSGDGSSILNILSGETTSRTSYGFGFDLEKRWDGGEWSLVWMQQDLKLVLHLTSNCRETTCTDMVSQTELYNITADQGERFNLAVHMPNRVEELNHELFEWFNDVLEDVEATQCNDAAAYGIPVILLLLLLFCHLKC